MNYWFFTYQDQKKNSNTRKSLKNEGKKKIANAKVNFYANPFLSGALFVPGKRCGDFRGLISRNGGFNMSVPVICPYYNNVRKNREIVVKKVPYARFEKLHQI